MRTLFTALLLLALPAASRADEVRCSEQLRDCGNSYAGYLRAIKFLEPRGGYAACLPDPHDAQQSSELREQCHAAKRAVDAGIHPGRTLPAEWKHHYPACREAYQPGFCPADQTKRIDTFLDDSYKNTFGPIPRHEPVKVTALLKLHLRSYDDCVEKLKKEKSLPSALLALGDEETVEDHCRSEFPTATHRARWDQVNGPFTTGWVTQASEFCGHQAQGCSCGGQNYCGDHANGETVKYWIHGCEEAPINIKCTIDGAAPKEEEPPASHQARRARWDQINGPFTTGWVSTTDETCGHAANCRCGDENDCGQHPNGAVVRYWVNGCDHSPEALRCTNEVAPKEDGSGERHGDEPLGGQHSDAPPRHCNGSWGVADPGCGAW